MAPLTSPRTHHLVSAETLLVTPPGQVVVLDVRAEAGDRSGRDAYLRGHIPGAVFVDLDADLSGPRTPQSGDRPLPEAGPLTDAVQAWGISPASTVVVYDDSRSAPAGRAWWVLRWAGLTDVRILDGGLAAWRGAGGSLEIGDARPPRGTAIARPGHLPVVTTDQIPPLARAGRLLDSRPADLYDEGRIPDAVSASVFGDLDNAGRLRTERELRARYDALHVDGTTPTATYCGSAVAAAFQVFVLATIGVEASLYIGSYSAWTSDPQRAVDRGTDAVPSHPTA
ncbi:sulfurtransferase [Rhodococcus sp. NPDC057014]|uniref:sulfurtransferase n=1 Tax=unclassified Rhodococcus (in: high G+C Gram-positive bacteria) TaxID=192944 RepID=UPI003645D7B7